MFKAVVFVCAQALLIQSISGQCIGARMAPYGAPGAGFGPYGIATPFAYEAAAVPSSYGGGLEIMSASAYPPSGVSVLSENIIEGPLAVAGALPFLGTVALEGLLPTAGSGAVNYGCGNGAVGIIAEEPFAAYGYADAYGPYAGPLRGAYGAALI